MLSKNRIQALPASIGGLRALKILLADVNALTRLPASLGLCCSLRILNLASNNLLAMPDEIGKLAELRVLNLSNNYLRSLPESIANLPNLTALWLNDNQKKPLVSLQRELDEKSNKEVLTCVLFPQTGPIFGPINPAVAAAVMAAAANTSANANRTGKPSKGMQAVGSPPETNGFQKEGQAKDKKQSQLHGALEYGVMTSSEYAQLAGTSGVTGSITPGTTGAQRCLAEEDELASDLLQMSNTLDKSAYQG